MQEAMIQLILTVLTAIATGAITIGIALLQSKLKNSQTSEALDRLQAVTESVIAKQQAEIVEGLKEANLDGKLTKGEIIELAALTKEQVFEALDKPAAEILQAVEADLEILIRGFTEQALQRMRGENFTQEMM